MASNSNAINLGATGAVPKERSSAVKSSTDANQCYEPPDIDPVTLKRNPKMELSKEDLLKLLSCLEGELQARDIVIATLKNEKVKQMLVHARYGKLNFADPLMALQRDGCCVKEQTLDEVAVRTMTDNQMSSLENLIRAQRTAQLKMVQYLQDADARHARVVQELQEEKSKHENDTTQGDDVMHALQQERTRLREELDNERAARQKLELELKKCAETLEEQQTRQKGMVLLLLAERKKIVAKYVEERKRSEDLAQIMSEEKGRVASMAEGLEEESKKSLLLEAELERHVSTFSTEKVHLKSALSKEEKRYQELLCEHEKLQRECDRLRNQLSEAHQVAMFQANSVSQRLAASGSSTTSRSAGQSTLPPSLANKPSSSSRSSGAGSSATLNPSKTGASGGGIRRSTSPGVAIGVTASPSVAASSSASVGTAAVDDPHQKTPHQTAAKGLPAGGGPPPVPAAHRSTDGTPVMSSSTQMGGMAFGSSPNTRNMAAYSGSSQPTGLPSTLSQQQQVRVAPRVSVASASPGTKVVSSSQPGRVLFHVTSPAVGGSTSSSTAGVTPRRPPLGRGVPPPVPPNKPAVPPLSSRPPPVPPTAPCGAGTSAPAPHGGSRPSPQVGAAAAAVDSASSLPRPVTAHDYLPTYVASMKGSTELDTPPPLPTCPPPARTPSPPPANVPPSPPSLSSGGVRNSGDGLHSSQLRGAVVSSNHVPDAAANLHIVCDIRLSTTSATTSTTTSPCSPPSPPTSSDSAASPSSTSSADCSDVQTFLRLATAAIIDNSESSLQQLLHETTADLTEMTQDGNSLFHLAASLGSAKCLRLLLHKWQSIYMTTDMIPVLQKENVAGVSVVHLACLRAEDQQLLALVDFCPQLKQLLQGQLLERLLRLASPVCQRYLRRLAEKQGGDHRSCIVYVESQVFSSTLQRVGEFRVTRSATWKSVSNECRHLFTTYLQMIDRMSQNEEECEKFAFRYFLETDKTDPDSLEIDGGKVALTLNLHGRRWTQRQDRLDLVPPADSQNSGCGDGRGMTRFDQRDGCIAVAASEHDVSTTDLSPWDFIRMKSAASDESSPLTLVISLPPVEDAALSCLMPVTFINRAVEKVEMWGAYQLLAPDGWWLNQISRSIVFVLSKRNPYLEERHINRPCLFNSSAVLVRLTDPAIVVVRENISSFHEELPNYSRSPRSLVVASCPLHADRSQDDDFSVPYDALAVDQQPLQSLFGRLLMRNLLAVVPETSWSSETVGLAALRWLAGLPFRLITAIEQWDMTYEQWDMTYGQYVSVDKFRLPSIERLAAAPIEFSRQEQPMLARWIEHVWSEELVPALKDFSMKSLHTCTLLESVREALLNKCPLAGDSLPVLELKCG